MSVFAGTALVPILRATAGLIYRAIFLQGLERATPSLFIWSSRKVVERWSFRPATKSSDLSKPEPGERISSRVTQACMHAAVVLTFCF
jgi:hypothetical protein